MTRRLEMTLISMLFLAAYLFFTLLAVTMYPMAAPAAIACALGALGAWGLR